jgi:hypothetical protein
LSCLYDVGQGLLIHKFWITLCDLNHVPCVSGVLIRVPTWLRN